MIVETMKNPWNIQSIYEFQFFNCPTCTFKNHSKQEFVNHAYELHPDSVSYLSNVNEIESFLDVICPWKTKDTNDQESVLKRPIRIPLKTKRITENSVNFKECFVTISRVIPNSCKICNKYFSNKHTYKDHMKSHDEKSVEDQTPNILKKCNECDDAYYTFSELEKHFALVHERVNLNRKGNACIAVESVDNL